MTVAAVICEYNPFHHGHSYQLSKIKELLGQDTVILSLMSGSTVQRGEVAISSKYQRAAAAVMAGSDLVLELPYPYCSSVAEHFALGAVSILSSIGVVDHLVFGSENTEIASLQTYASRRQSAEFLDLLSLFRKDYKDLSYPQLIDLCYRTLYGESFPKGPNDILGIYYLMAIDKLSSSIVPHTHKRLPGSSATLSRKKVKSGDLSGIPEKLHKHFAFTASLEKAERAILAVLRQHPDVVVRKAASCATSYAELTMALSDKNSTDARVRRDILHAMLGYREEDFTLPRFTTVLAMSEKGSALLHRAKRISEIPIITKPSSYKKYTNIQEQFEINLRADGLFALCCDEILPHGWSLKETPFGKK